MIVRRYKDADLESVATLFTETVRHINLRDYSPEQVAAWAPQPPDFLHWRKRVRDLTLWVAESDNQIVGFCGLGADGYIDLFYTHHHFQRRGIARCLYQHLEIEARRRGARRLFTDASLTARPFFASLGFRTLHEQQVKFRGVFFQNYAMEKLWD